MFRMFLVSIALSFGLWTVVFAESTGPRFAFQKGQEFTYKVEQVTNASETAIDEKTTKPVSTQVTTKLNLIKKWKVVEVDNKGIATIQLSLASMRMEKKSGDGEVDVFDSAKPDKENQAEMAKLINKTLAVLRIDPQGKLVEVKESNFGPASRFVTDLPFKVELPAQTPKQGDSWQRKYNIKLDPPHGTGESYEASQSYTLKAPVNGYTVIGFTTNIKDLPPPNDQIPLLPLMQEGDVYLHPKTGHYFGCRLKIHKELTNHQGEGSKYVFVSTYAEDLQTK